MCGICGIINFNNKPVEEISIRQMMRVMKHRGPDDDGVFIDKNIGLGFVRLSILDLSFAGHQPMLSHNGQFVIVFNGEVYNYIELREELKSSHEFSTGTDTEVVLAAYQEWGEKCLDKFNGMFSFIIFDKKSRNIFGARDRFGIKPFYYFNDESHFIFASEIDPILSVIKRKVSPNEENIYNFLAHNRTDYNESTFFNEINKLGHGCFFNLNKKGIVINKWYDLNEKVRISDSFSSTDQFSDLLTESVSLRLRSDVPVGVCLSGGLDSSTIIRIISDKLQLKEVNSFSAIYNEGQKGDESFYIRSLQRPVEHSFFTKLDENNFIKDLEGLLEVHPEPFPGTAVYSQYKVMELAHGKVSVLLDGQGADEYLAGYHYFYGVYYKELIKQWRLLTFFGEFLAYQKLYKNPKSLLSTLFYFLPASFRNTIEQHNRGNYIKADFISKFSQKDIIASKLHNSNKLKTSLINHFEYKLEHLLKWEDLNSMAFSIESRVPFLDYRLVEKTLASPNNYKIHKGYTKRVLRDSFRSILPNEIINRKDKIGFLNPRNEWLKTENTVKLFKEVLNDSNLGKRGIINNKEFDKLYTAFLIGKKDYSKEIWKVFVLEKWFRKYFKT